MSNARNLSSSANDQAHNPPPSSSSSTSAMFSTWSSSAEIETKEEKEANGREEKHSKSPIATINEDVAETVASYLNPKELAAVLQTNKDYQTILKPSMDALALRTLFQAIVDGDYKKVEKIITSRPELLLKELGQKPITSLSGQKSNNVTPYRTALAVEDIEIATLIKNKMVELYAGHVADQQYREQFPEGWEAEEKQRWAPVFTQLTTLTHAIRDAKPGDIIASGHSNYQSATREGSVVEVELKAFLSLLTEKLNQTITTGRHFNPSLLLRALEIYDQHYEEYFGNNSHDPRAALFWQRIIGGIQCGLPVNDMQALCDGLYSSIQKLALGEAQGRSLTMMVSNAGLFDTWVRTNVYSLSAPRLGESYATSGATISTRQGTYGDGMQTCVRFHPYYFARLFQSKAVRRQDLAPSTDNTLKNSHRPS